LFTGASSFTGAWFIKALAEQGANIVAVTRRPASSYEGIAALRLAMARDHARVIDECAFGSSKFLKAIAAHGPFDVICLHAAGAAGHRDPGFDPLAAFEANCRDIGRVFATLAEDRPPTILATGSVFEADEGAGSPPAGAVGAYGLSKTITWQVMRFHAERSGLALAKFVIPHPIGPLEKPGLTSGLARAWLEGRVPMVRQPHLVRDVVPVDRLAICYSRFAAAIARGAPCRRLAPSGWIETTHDFAARFAAAMRQRLGIPCPFTSALPPTDNIEPVVRCNTDPVDRLCPEWSEAVFWDRLAHWYRSPEAALSQQQAS
jgi:nucleoside-diphosphate-sugar epimerase